MYRAKRYSELINWWMADGRLASHLSETKPHVEDALDDIQYTLLATLATTEYRIALQVLILAAEISQGVDVFALVARRYPRIVVEQDYVGRLLVHLRRRDDGYELRSDLFRLARALVEYDNSEELAKQLTDEGYELADREKRNRRRNTTWSPQDVVDIAVYEAYTDGLEAGIVGLSRWKPKQAVALAYSRLTYIWCQNHAAEDVVSIVQQQTLNKKQMTYALLGVLGSGNIDDNTACLLADTILKDLRKPLLKEWGEREDSRDEIAIHPSQVLDNLIRRGLNQAATALIDYWSIRKPFSYRLTNQGFAQYAAYQHLLQIAEMDLGTFELEQRTDEKGSRSEHQRQERQEENSRARQKLQLLFPPQLLRLRVLAGTAPEEILKGIDEFLSAWKSREKPYWYEFFAGDVQGSFGHLIEAVVLLPGYHVDVIRRIIDVTERLTGIRDHYGLTKYAEILSYHDRYHAEAERLILRRLDAIRVPEYSASEAVEALLDLYTAAARVDPNLAAKVFVQARVEAGGWDSRIDGSAYALLATLQHGKSAAAFTSGQLDELVAIFQVIKKVTEGSDVDIHLDWLTRLLMSVDPSYTYAALIEFDKSGFIDLRDSLEGVALGLLEHRVPAQGLYPLAYIVPSVNQAVSIFEQAIVQLNGTPQDTAIAQYAAYIKKETLRDRRDFFAEQLVAWAKRNGLSQHPSVLEMADLAAQLAQFKVSDDQGRVRRDEVSSAGAELLTRVENAVANVPQQALQLLLDAGVNDLSGLPFHA